MDREKVIADLEAYRDRNFIREGKTVFDNDPRYRKKIINNAIALLKEQDNCENCAIAIEDRQLVVRCKDCKHFDYGRLYKCRIHGSLFQPKDDDWFCADGERMDRR